MSPVLLVTAILGPNASIQGQTTVLVRVDAVVRDAGGQPVAGVEFWDRWVSKSGQWTGSMGCPIEGTEVLRSDAAGRLRGHWRMGPLATPLLGWSGDRSKALFVKPQWRWTELGSMEPVIAGELVVVDVISVRGRARTSRGSEAAGTVSLSLRFWSPSEVHAAREFLFSSDRLSFDLPLPRDAKLAFELRVGSGCGTSPRRGLDLGTAADVIDLGPISVPQKPFDLIGEVFPDWEIGSVENARVEDCRILALRRKPAVVFFGVFDWRTPFPNQRQALANLAVHPRRGDFRVVLFDSAYRDTPLDERQGPLVETMFPVVKPPSSTYVQDHYGSTYATIVLDRDGRLVHCGDPDSASVALTRHLPPDLPPDRPRNGR